MWDGKFVSGMSFVIPLTFDELDVDLTEGLQQDVAPKPLRSNQIEVRL